MAGTTTTERPRRADVTPSYDLGVDAYVGCWSPVILPPAESVVATLGLRTGSRVLDVGSGAGALVPSIRAAAAGVTSIGLDPSREMLREARRATSVPAVQGDALALPFRAASVDAVMLAFVLFHLSDPSAAITEVSRVLTIGGVVGTVTWMRDDPVAADGEWDAILDEAGAPPLPLRRVDTGLDSPDAIDALLSHAGLEVTRLWTADVHHRWDRSSFWAHRIRSGVTRIRLSQLAPAARAEVVQRARRRLDALPPDAFMWSGAVVCATAAKPAGSGEG